MNNTAKRVRVPELALMKERGERVVMLTAYDATMARLLDQAGQAGKQEQDWAGEAGHGGGIRAVIPGANWRGQSFCKGLKPSRCPMFARLGPTLKRESKGCQSDRSKARSETGRGCQSGRKTRAGC